jgi:hypothetical protein
MTPGLDLSPAQVTAVEAARTEVCALHAALVENGLVAWTSGNVSARVRGTSADLMVIKPSGVAYADLTPHSMVVCDLDGHRMDGEYSPSSDTAAHAYIYRHMPEVEGVVHTHSTYATGWAARGEPVPCVITAMADEFGGEIPVGPFALIGGDEIGRGVVATLTGHRFHDRAERPRRRQGRRDVRGRCPYRAHSAHPRRAHPAAAGRHRSLAPPLHPGIRPAVTPPP